MSNHVGRNSSQSIGPVVFPEPFEPEPGAALVARIENLVRENIRLERENSELRDRIMGLEEALHFAQPAELVLTFRPEGSR